MGIPITTTIAGQWLNSLILHDDVMAHTLSSDPNSVWVLYGWIKEGAKDSNWLKLHAQVILFINANLQHMHKHTCYIITLLWLPTFFILLQ